VRNRNFVVKCRRRRKGAREGTPDAKTFATFLPNGSAARESKGFPRIAPIASISRSPETASSEKENRLSSILFALYINAAFNGVD
ncbi:MAG: hypothetical protein IJO40_03180, partial [Thermoguttaceae bacterium]|nr:hypothetical protein [Thermoguttaceae bacterium]